MRAITVLVLAGLLACAAARCTDKKVVCYFGSWATYRPGNGKFEIENIDPKLCTHLIYSFVGLNETGDVSVLDPALDLAADGGKNGFARFVGMRKVSPSTKYMIAMGGWNEGSVKYSKVFNDAALRAKLVDNVVAFVKKHGFDGFDLDWEYPNQRDGIEADKQNFVLFLKALRERFDKEGLVLSAAVAAAEVSASKSYLVAEVSKYLHFINLMTYDLHGSWDGKTGINAPLYSGSWESGADLGLTVNASVNYWLSHGAPANKLVVGVPFYGRGFTLSNSDSNDIGALTTGPSNAGPYTREAGTLGYNEICQNIIYNNWDVNYQEEQRVPYAVSGNQWVGYDDRRSLNEKADFVKSLGLGGIMIWSVETDDFRGICGEAYTLLKTINYALEGPQCRPRPPHPKPHPPPGSKPQPEGTPAPQPKPTPTPQPQPTPKPTDPCNAPAPPIPNPTPKPPSSVCSAEGYVRDAKNCNLFYYCRADGSEYIVYKFNCPDDLAFDTTSLVCNYRKNVSGC